MLKKRNYLSFLNKDQSATDNDPQLVANPNHNRLHEQGLIHTHRYIQHHRLALFHSELLKKQPCLQLANTVNTYFSRNVNLDASKRRIKLSHSVLKLANNNDHLEEYFAAFDLDDDTQNEKRV